ncbi:MAG: hypothetical protein IJ740_08530 [Ruminococcus sp.]|nr:hypothetical protein [Ruminococcus sp.]
MKTADLSRYRKLAERLECIEEQLEHKEVHDAVIGDSGAPAYSKVTKPVEGYIHGFGTVSLLAEKAACLHKMESIVDYILAIPSSRVRRALKLYCLSDTTMTWQEVAEKMGERDCRALVKTVERCLAKIEQNTQKKE